MPLPTAYTEQTLAQYMESCLGRVALALDLHTVPDGAGEYQEAVHDTLLLYGTDDLSAVTGQAALLKLRALAKVAIWRHVVGNFVALYDFSADGGSFSRSQLFHQAKEALQLAEEAALAYDPNYQASVVRLVPKHDPYTYRPEEERSA